MTCKKIYISVLLFSLIAPNSCFSMQNLKKDPSLERQSSSRYFPALGTPEHERRQLKKLRQQELRRAIDKRDTQVITDDITTLRRRKPVSSKVNRQGSKRSLKKEQSLKKEPSLKKENSLTKQSSSRYFPAAGTPEYEKRQLKKQRQTERDHLFRKKVDEIDRATINAELKRLRERKIVSE